jgi:hypothetical protein
MKTNLAIKRLWSLFGIALAGAAYPAEKFATPAGTTRKPEAPKIQQAPTLLRFSGYDWTIKSTGTRRHGPGPNYFGATNCWVDPQGRLHLKIAQEKDRWTCAEIISRRSFGFGTYRFFLDTPQNQLDANVVLGLFTWSDGPKHEHREIDIECSRWSKPEDPQNAQFVVQPYQPAGHRLRFPVAPDLSAGTYSFCWQSNQVAFLALQGHARTSSAMNPVIREWTFHETGTPQPGNENVRINLWLFRGRAPSDEKELEVVLSKFEFQPIE